MEDVLAAVDQLARVAQFVHVVIRFLDDSKGIHISPQAVSSLLVDILELINRTKDRYSSGKKKPSISQPEYHALSEMLEWFQSTLRTIELYFQPGAMQYFGQHLLEKTFLPQLQQYKILFILSTESESESVYVITSSSL